MSVGLNTNNEIANSASITKVADVQQQNFKGHKVSLGEKPVLESFSMSDNAINFPNKTLAQRHVSLANNS